MGGLRAQMPITFAAYTVGMLALSGFPIFFSGFWSQDAIVGAAHHWPVSQGPFWMLLIGALLTAFYMMRQVGYVFLGSWRGHGHAHESPAVMTIPLVVLAFFAMALGVLGTPAWPWFTAFLDGRSLAFDLAGFSEPGLVAMMLLASTLVFVALGVGWRLYVTQANRTDTDPDVLQRVSPRVFGWLESRLYFDELYQATILRAYAFLAWLAAWLDRRFWGSIVASISSGFRGLGWCNRSIDSQWIDGGFDKGCEELTTAGGVLAWLQAGRAPNYLRTLTIGLLILLAVVLMAASITGQVKL